jgi:hypothetical protein
MFCRLVFMLYICINECIHLLEYISAFFLVFSCHFGLLMSFFSFRNADYISMLLHAMTLRYWPTPTSYSSLRYLSVVCGGTGGDGGGAGRNLARHARHHRSRAILRHIVNKL